MQRWYHGWKVMSIYLRRKMKEKAKWDRKKQNGIKMRESSRKKDTLRRKYL
jgi:hypothetical protein